MCAKKAEAEEAKGYNCMLFRLGVITGNHAVQMTSERAQMQPSWLKTARASQWRVPCPQLLLLGRTLLTLESLLWAQKLVPLARLALSRRRGIPGRDLGLQL